MSDVTRILSQINDGDPSAAEQLLPLVYDELRKLAAAKMAQENPGQTLQATALVHEAYIRLVDQTWPQRWDGRRHFFAAAAEAMRRILVEQARHKKSHRAGGSMKRVDFDDVDLAVAGRPDDLLALDDAVEILARHDHQAAEVAKLRLFAGLTVDDTASVLGTPRTTAFRLWTYARAFLQFRLRAGGQPGDASRS